MNWGIKQGSLNHVKLLIEFSKTMNKMLDFDCELRFLLKIKRSPSSICLECLS